MLYVFAVDFEISVTPDVRIFTFRNMTVTKGPNEGVTDPQARSYLYQIRNDTWIEAWGLLNGDPTPPRVSTYQRVKE